MRRAAARLIVAGTGSGCGKTTATCAILQALADRGADVAAFKCGPDYIDPMFHSEIIGADGGNIDLFFTGRDAARSLFLTNARGLNVVEGAMGYYDGLSARSAEASTWAVAEALDAPALLVVNARAMALSAAAVVKGFLSLRDPRHLAGVLQNGVSAHIYPDLKAVIEAECGVRVYRYLPNMPECVLESRHLGLVTAREVDGLRRKTRLLAAQAEKSVDIDGLIELMQSQPALEAKDLSVQRVADVRIAVARDRAFCFYYRDNLMLLEALGATLVPFSPLTDAALPDCDGLYIGGGYPELHTRALAENAGMRRSIRDAVRGCLPTVAECGGFMYLTENIDGFPMAGVLPGNCADRGRLVRFGYVALRADSDSLLFGAGESIRGHEFHHWDAESPGDALTAVKPSGRSWRCAHATDTLYAGFPHLSFWSNPGAAERFVRKCAERNHGYEADGHRTAQL